MGNRRLAFCLLVFLALSLSGCLSQVVNPTNTSTSSLAPEPTPSEPIVSFYLSELEPTVAEAAGGNYCVGQIPQGDPPRCVGSLKHDGFSYKHSLYAHADSAVEFSLNGEFNQFKSSLFMMGGECGDGAVFSVYLDGAKLYESPQVSFPDEVLEIELDISSGQILRLETSVGPRNDYYCDGSVWGEPQVVSSHPIDFTSENFEKSTILPPSPTATAIPINPRDDAQLIYIPAGEFVMGSSEGRRSEQPEHNVYLDAFWIYRTEITNEQFSMFVSDTNYRTEAEKKTITYVYVNGEWSQVYGAYWADPIGDGLDIEGFGNLPVVQVSWNDALAYCEWAGGRLPTEAEWEKAARGVDGRIFPWGNEYDPSLVSSFENPVRSQSFAPVGSFEEGASPYGVLDMAGNVGEWVADFYNAEYYQISSLENPQGPAAGLIRVMRGGSWGNGMPYYQTWFRTGAAPTRTWNTIGFRCALSEGF